MSTRTDDLIASFVMGLFAASSIMYLLWTVEYKSRSPSVQIAAIESTPEGRYMGTFEKCLERLRSLTTNQSGSVVIQMADTCRLVMNDVRSIESRE
jgi:hypothetical protein